MAKLEKVVNEAAASAEKAWKLASMFSFSLPGLERFLHAHFLPSLLALPSIEKIKALKPSASAGQAGADLRRERNGELLKLSELVDRIPPA